MRKMKRNKGKMMKKEGKVKNQELKITYVGVVKTA